MGVRHPRDYLKELAPGARDLPGHAALTAPTALADFPQENFIPLRHIAERMNNIVRWPEFDRGGHFAAMEEPDLFGRGRTGVLPPAPRISIPAEPSEAGQETRLGAARRSASRRRISTTLGTGSSLDSLTINERAKARETRILTQYGRNCAFHSLHLVEPRGSAKIVFAGRSSRVENRCG
jgi:hypothetical protein